MDPEVFWFQTLFQILVSEFGLRIWFQKLFSEFGFRIWFKICGFTPNLGGWLWGKVKAGGLLGVALLARPNPSLCDSGMYDEHIALSMYFVISCI